MPRQKNETPVQSYLRTLAEYSKAQAELLDAMRNGELSEADQRAVQMLRSSFPGATARNEATPKDGTKTEKS